MQVDPPDTEQPLLLTAVAMPSGVARFERYGNGEYQPIESIPVTHDLAQFGAATPYRILLPGKYRAGQKVPLTLLFTGGTMLQRQALVEGSSGSRWSWLWIALLLVGLAAGMALSLRRYQHPCIRSTQ